MLDEITWTLVRKWNVKRESESPLRAAQNSTIRTIYVKAKIDKNQRNEKCRLCCDRDKANNRNPQIRTKKDLTKLGGELDPLEIVQKNESWSHEKVVYKQSWIHPVEWDVQIFFGFCDANALSNLGHTTRSRDSQRKKRTCRMMNQAVLQITE